MKKPRKSRSQAKQNKNSSSATPIKESGLKTLEVNRFNQFKKMSADVDNLIHAQALNNFNNFLREQNLDENGDFEGDVEPHEYFAHLKERMKNVQIEELNSGINFYAKQLMQAEKNKQKRLFDALLFHGNVIFKELQLKSSGITKYVLRDDLDKFLDRITPKNSIKIIELERYTRLIPEENSKRIQEVLDMGIFDEMCVLFTDFTEKTYATPEEKEVIERNRDPIVFGYFKDREGGFELSKRFYYITDWIDEYCDLTLEKLSEMMIQQKITEEPVFDVSTDKKILEQYIQKGGDKMGNQDSPEPELLIAAELGRNLKRTSTSEQTPELPQKAHKVGIWEKVKSFFGG